MRYVFILILLLCSCKGKFIVEESEPPQISTQSVSCNYSSYCYACGLNFEMEYTCGMRFSNQCKGHQKAKVRFIRHWGYYENNMEGPRVFQEESRVLERLTPCK